MYNNSELMTKVGMFKHFPLSLFWMFRAKSIVLVHMYAKASTVLNSPSWTNISLLLPVCVFPSSEGDGVADVCDDLLFLPDVAVQPVHPPGSGSCHLHA